jgi:hypothetical protein
VNPKKSSRHPKGSSDVELSTAFIGPNAQREPRRFSGVGSTLLFDIYFSHLVVPSVVNSADSALVPVSPREKD